MQQLTTQELKQKINNKENFVLDLFATWCGPCKMLSPIIEKVKEQLGEEATILKVDVDKNPEVIG